MHPTHFAVLVSDASQGVTAGRERLLQDALAASTSDVGVPRWLAPHIAVEVPFATPGAPPSSDDLRAALGEEPIDVAIVPAAGRRKRLLIADMDSTIVIGETLDELADEAGIKDKVAEITARAMNGEIDFKGALRERVALLAGLPAAALDRTYERVRLMPGAQTLVHTMRANGAYALLVSGGFHYSTNRIRERAGFDEDQSNDLLLDGDRLSGRVAEPILDRDAKLAALLRACAERGLTAADAVAVGDGANDLAMIQTAGLGVAYQAKPVVAAQAQVRIEHGDLTALLYLQGYSRDEFVD